MNFDTIANIAWCDLYILNLLWTYQCENNITLIKIYVKLIILHSVLSMSMPHYHSHTNYSKISILPFRSNMYLTNKQKKSTKRYVVQINTLLNISSLDF